jgi:hypothetical protein
METLVLAWRNGESEGKLFLPLHACALSVATFGVHLFLGLGGVTEYSVGSGRFCPGYFFLSPLLTDG